MYSESYGAFLQYRLKQIDNDGKFSYSDEVQVNVKFIPTEFSLGQNYPNPFNPVTTIRYSIPSETNSQWSNVNLKVYDVLGTEVAVLLNEPQKPGYHEVIFEVKNLASGVYYYRIEAGDFTATKRLMILK